MPGEFVSNRFGIFQFKHKFKINIEECNNLYLLGMPGVGKTAFLKNIMQEISSDQLLCIYIDVARHLLSKSEQSFFDHLKQHLGIFDNTITSIDDLFSIEHLPGNYKKVVLMLDHIDSLSIVNISKCSLRNLDDCLDDIGGLKDWARNTNVSIIFCGRRHYSVAADELKRDLNESLETSEELGIKVHKYSEIIASSGPYTAYLYYKGFNKKETILFCQKFVNRRGSDLIEKYVKDINLNNIYEKVYYDVGNHPKMISQFLISFIVEIESLIDQGKDEINEEELGLIFKSSLISSEQTFFEICQSVYKYAVGLKERNLLNDILDKNEKLSINVSNELFIDRGIFIERDNDNKIVTFSPYFHKYINDICSNSLKKEACKVDSKKDDICVELKNSNTTVILKGKVGRLFYSIYKNKDMVASKDELIDILYSNTRSSNSLYQLKNNLVDKINELYNVESYGGDYKLVELSTDIQVNIYNK